MKRNAFQKLPEKIRSKIVFLKCPVPRLTGPCWIWRGYVRKGAQGKGGGYGTIDFDGRKYYAHRLVYVLTGHRIPPRKQLDHKCRVRRCCSPNHIEPITHLQNIMRGDWFIARNARKTTCPKGHTLSDAILRYRVGQKNPQRNCRTCATEQSRRYRAEHLEEIRRRQREAYRRKCAGN